MTEHAYVYYYIHTHFLLVHKHIYTCMHIRANRHMSHYFLSVAVVELLVDLECCSGTPRFSHQATRPQIDTSTYLGSSQPLKKRALFSSFLLTRSLSFTAKMFLEASPSFAISFPDFLKAGMRCFIPQARDPKPRRAWGALRFFSLEPLCPPYCSP